MSNALYLYCLTRGRLVPYLESAGITGSETIMMKDFSDVTAVMCEVPEDEFAGASAEVNLQNLAWIAPKAVRHELVIEEVMRYAPVLPARFGSLFSSVESLATLVEANMTTIDRFFDEIAEKEEWSVKTLLDKGKALDGILADKLQGMSDNLSSLSPGLRYFKERQVRHEVEKQLAAVTKQNCNAVAKRLANLTAGARQRKIIDLPNEENERQAVVNWAFLVEHSLVANFLKHIDQVNSEYNTKGLFFECSGPWPPYSFCPSLELERQL